MEKQKEFELHFRQILELFGENPGREGLLDTPRRVFETWKTLLSGTKQDPKALLECTFAETENYNDIVLLKNIEFHSTCEHHLLPILGIAHVASQPRERVVGLSKLARLVDCFAHRLQLQERMTRQITDALMKHLAPLGAAVVLEATHLCIECRGVNKLGGRFLTCSFQGSFENSAVREKFFQMLSIPKTDQEMAISDESASSRDSPTFRFRKDGSPW